MAEKVKADSRTSSSDSEPEVEPARTLKKPPLKRRRLFTAAAVPAVPVYSSKVQNSLQLLPDSLKLPVPDPELSSEAQILGLSNEDEEEETAVVIEQVEEKNSRCQVSSPSPPPQLRRSHRCQLGAQLLDQRLKNLKSSLLAAKKSLQDEGLQTDRDDVILIDSPEPSESRKLILKIRCRTDLHRIPVRMTDPLLRVVEHMGQTLNVHPSRILLLFRDRELATDATPRRLGLGVADIIDCVVEATSEGNADSRKLQIRVQGKDKSSEMEITVQRGEPLQILMAHYRHAQCLDGHKLAFYFDGRRLAENWTPEELGMESGDVIEVWS